MRSMSDELIEFCQKDNHFIHPIVNLLLIVSEKSSNHETSIMTKTMKNKAKVT